MGIKIPTWPTPLGHKPIDLGLERVQQAAHRLAIDEASLPPIVHVAGTNGKGSTIAFMRSLLEAKGLRVHVYSSPHLQYFNERIMLAGEIISDDALRDILNRTRAACEDIGMTFFEATTIAALLAFKETQADYVLLETGLGGRLDATNIFQHPVATVITPIAEDHQEYLGKDIADIAAEKAGILKTDVPLVLARQPHAQAEATIRKIASQKHVPVIDAGDPVAQELALSGAHQKENAATALACVAQALSLAVSDAEKEAAFLHVHWPARLQRLADGHLQHMLGDAWKIQLDGGHNPHAAQAIAAVLKAWPQPITMAVAMKDDKYAKDFLSLLLPLVHHAIALPLLSEPASFAPETLCELAKELGHHMQPAQNIEQAVKIAQQHSAGGTLLFCGSLYLAGEVLTWDEQS